MSTRRPASRLATPVPHGNGNNGQRSAVVLGPNDRLVGQLFIEGDLRVAGTVDGTLEATGDIEISGAGKVSGDVTAYNRLTVCADASLVAGEVHVARLTVEDGAMFTGKVSMGSNAAESKREAAIDPVPAPAATPPAPTSEAIEVVVAPPEPLKKTRRR